MFVSTTLLTLVAMNGTQDNKIEELTNLVYELQNEVAELKQGKSTNWLNEQRAEKIKAIVDDALTDADTRSSLLGDGVLAGYDKGAFLTSADGNWKLKINGQLQSRWIYNNADGQSTNHGFEQRRTKLKFSGSVIDPSVQYKITGTWSRGGGSNTEDAYMVKSFDNGSWFKFGQFKANFLRENIVSSSKQLGVERSMLNNAFTWGWTQGIELGWKNDDTKIILQYSDGPGQANTMALSAPTNGWIARAEHRFGDASLKDFAYLTSKAGAEEGLLLGVSYENYNNDSSTFEYGNANGSKSSGWTVDATLRGDGWNVFGYVVDTSGEAAGSKQGSSGWLIQGGILVTEKMELFVQYQEGTIENQNMDMDVFRVGCNIWPNPDSNNVKWTTDIGWAGKTLSDGAGSGISSADWVSSGNGWRADNAGEDDQMLIRTQLQLLF